MSILMTERGKNVEKKGKVTPLREQLGAVQKDGGKRKQKANPRTSNLRTAETLGEILKIGGAS